MIEIFFSRKFLFTVFIDPLEQISHCTELNNALTTIKIVFKIITQQINHVLLLLLFSLKNKLRSKISKKRFFAKNLTHKETNSLLIKLLQCEKTLTDGSNQNICTVKLNLYTLTLHKQFHRHQFCTVEHFIKRILELPKNLQLLKFSSKLPKGLVAQWVKVLQSELKGRQLQKELLHENPGDPLVIQ